MVERARHILETENSVQLECKEQDHRGIKKCQVLIFILRAMENH